MLPKPSYGKKCLKKSFLWHALNHRKWCGYSCMGLWEPAIMKGNTLGRLNFIIFGVYVFTPLLTSIEESVGVTAAAALSSCLLSPLRLTYAWHCRDSNKSQ